MPCQACGEDVALRFEGTENLVDYPLPITVKTDYTCSACGNLGPVIIRYGGTAADEG